jgi:hypothetical protein
MKIKEAIIKRGLMQREDELSDETMQRVADAIGCDLKEIKSETLEYNFDDKTEDGLSPIAIALVGKALAMGEITTENPIEIEQWDLDRIYLKVDGVPHTIRTWDVHETAKTVVVRWSLFCNGKELCSSVTTKFRIADYEKAGKPQESYDDKAENITRFDDLQVEIEIN